MENLLINIINTSLFSLLVLINIIICFTFGSFTLKKVIPLKTHYQVSDNINICITIIIGFIIICSFLSL
mgnify:CR=1